MGETRLIGPLDDAEALDEATRARDRAAVRALIARRPPPEKAMRVSSKEFDSEDFACPVCRELRWKPVVKACGHAACFMYP